MLLQLAKPSLSEFLKIVHRSIFSEILLNSIFPDTHDQIFFIILNIDSKCFIIKSKLQFFNVHVRIFATGGLWSPIVAKSSIIFSTSRTPHHNLITHPVFSITKESNCQNNSRSSFPPNSSKNASPSKISNSP